MRMIVASALLVLASGVALAQKEELKPAPVPNVSPGAVTPADRAGKSNGPDNSSPFSGAPTGAVAGSGQATPQTQAETTKQGVPTPSLSR